MKIGLLSDTHQILRPSVLQVVKTCDEIWHCGDFCNTQILHQLRLIAPVRAVRGNNDHEQALLTLPLVEQFEWEGLSVALAHQRSSLLSVSAQLRCFGHTHRLCDETVDGVRWLNPGGCGRRRFALELTMMVLTLKQGKLQVTPIWIAP